LYSTSKVTVKIWHLSVFGNKIVYNTSLFAFKSIATAREGTGGRVRAGCVILSRPPPTGKLVLPTWRNR